MIPILAGLIAGAAAPMACTLPTGWAAVAAARPRFVVFGEVHGTEEAPAFVGRVACALAARGRRVLVAIELSPEDGAVIRSAWRLPPARFAAAVSKARWTERRDGKGSAAMMRLLVGLHRAKGAGNAINVTAFDMGAESPSHEPPRRPGDLTGNALREAVQVENIAAAAAAGRYDVVIVLTGNIHARKVPVTFGGETYEPMAMRLARSGRLVSLNARTAGGSEWGCRLRQGVTFVPGTPLPKDAISCAAHPVRGDPAAGRPGSITLVPAGTGKGAGSGVAYDGVFDLGPVTASPPAAGAASPPGGG